MPDPATNLKKRMKRARDDTVAMGAHGEEGDHDDDIVLLLSLSCGSSSTSTCSSEEEAAAERTAPPPPLRRRRGGMEPAPFECRTCGRQFATFQALGGHRTSHLRRPATKLRPKAVAAVHACARCGLGFSTGQALGGHMRRHRRAATSDEEEDCRYVGLTQTIIMHERPTNPASLQLLNLFV